MASREMHSGIAAGAAVGDDPLDLATARLADAAATHRAVREHRMTRLSGGEYPGNSHELACETLPGPAPHLESHCPRGPPEAFLVNDRRAAAALGVSTATLWRGAKDGRFPRPVRVGGCTRWLWTEIEDAVRKAVRARDGVEG